MNRSLIAGILLGAAGAAVASPPDVQTLTVRRAVQLALERAPEVAAARSAAEATGASVQIVESDRKPQLFVSTTPGYSTGVPLSVAGEVPAAAGARLRMTLYDPYQRDEEFQARAQASASDAALSDARVEIARRTVAACAKLRADEARAASARRRLESRDAILGRERALLREGRRTDLDVERAALEQARARQKLYAAESDRDLDRYELARLVGLPSGAALAVADDPAEAMPPSLPGDSAALAISRDPQLQALAQQADALSRSARLLAQTFKPIVNAEGRYAFVPRAFGYDKYYLSFQENVASVGVSVVLPVLTGGREGAQAAQKQARLREVEFRRKVRELDLAQEARALEARVERSGLDAGLARRALGVAEESLRQAQALTREGRGGADDSDRAQIQLSDAEEDLASAGREQAEARLRLLVLRGELLSAFEDEAVPDSRP